MVDINAMTESKMTERKMTDSEIENLLRTQRDELRALIAANATDSAPVALDQTQQGRLSRMDAMQQQAMASETLRRRQLQIKKIEAALERLGNGEFGYCVICGDKIEAKRLALDAAVPTCVTHAK